MNFLREILKKRQQQKQMHRIYKIKIPISPNKEKTAKIEIISKKTLTEQEFKKIRDVLASELRMKIFDSSTAELQLRLILNNFTGSSLKFTEIKNGVMVVIG